MGLTDEQVDSIIEMHTDTVDGLKTDIARYKADAEKLPGVQTELDNLKAKGDDGWKDRHDTVKKEFDEYKQSVEARDSKAAREKAARAYFESKNITGRNLDIAMRGASAEIDGIELDGEAIKDAAALDALVNGTFAGLVVTESVSGANTSNPPANNAGRVYTRDEIRKMTPDEINKNFDAIQASLRGENS